MNNQAILHVIVENPEAAHAAARYLGYAEVTNLTLPGVLARTRLMSAYLVGSQTKVKDNARRTLISVGEYYQLVKDGKVEYCGKINEDQCIIPEVDAYYMDGRKRVGGVMVDGNFLCGHYWWVNPDGTLSGNGGRWKITLA